MHYSVELLNKQSLYVLKKKSECPKYLLKPCQMRKAYDKDNGDTDNDNNRNNYNDGGFPIKIVYKVLYEIHLSL